MTRSETVRIARELRASLVSQARQAAPREACGLLVGRDRRVLFAVETPNRSRGNRRFRVDPRTHIELRRLLRATRPALAVVGVYHSHPAGPAEPSETDVEESHYEDWIHLIVSLQRSPVIRAFAIAAGRSRPLAIRWQE